MSDHDKKNKDNIPIYIPDPQETERILKHGSDAHKAAIDKIKQASDNAKSIADVLDLHNTGSDLDTETRPVRNHGSFTEKMIQKGPPVSVPPSVDRAAEQKKLDNMSEDEKQDKMDGFMKHLLDGHVRILNYEDVESTFLKGRIQESVKYHLTPDDDLAQRTSYLLSASINLDSITNLHHEGPGAEEAIREQRDMLDFHQQRQTVLTLGSFESFNAAKTYLSHLDQYMMHILALNPVHQKKLQITTDGTPYFQMLDEDFKKSAQAGYSYNAALRDTTLVEAFHRVNLGQEFSFREAVGRIIKAVLHDISLEHTAQDIPGQTSGLKYIFDRDVGYFEIYDQGDHNPAYMTRTDFSGARSDNEGKVAFEGPVTGITVMQEFIQRLCHAAAERQIIDKKTLQNYSDNIDNVRGIPLEDTPGLGLLSPFYTAEPNSGLTH